MFRAKQHENCLKRTDNSDALTLMLTTYNQNEVRQDNILFSIHISKYLLQITPN